MLTRVGPLHPMSLRQSEPIKLAALFRRGRCETQVEEDQKGRAVNFRGG